jgi:ATP adenylyltransferase
MDYIRSLEKSPEERSACFFCDAGTCSDEKECRDRLVLWRSPHSVVLINRFPYTNGHLLIAPRAHKAEMEQLSADELTDLQVQTVKSLGVLRQAISPQGFNIGVNIGRCAGAGVPGHLHQHVVPRWGGDTNFMSVVGEVRVVPQALSQLYDELIRVVNSGLETQRAEGRG